MTKGNRKSMLSKVARISCRLGNVCLLMIMTAVLTWQTSRHVYSRSQQTGMPKTVRGAEKPSIDKQNSLSLSEQYKCDEMMTKERPIYDEDTFARLQNLYREIAGNDTGHKPSALPFQSGFHVPVEVKQTHDGKGRGVFAKENIKAGTLVWSSRQTVLFRSSEMYKRFVLAIDDKGLACDIMEWAYKTKWLAVEPFAICLDLNEGSLVNSGSREKNLASIPDAVQGGCHQSMPASRNIEKGEEILCNYGDFVQPTRDQIV